MKVRIGWLLLLACSAGAVPAAESVAPDWLEGTWRRETARGTAYERWRAVSPRTLEGEAWLEATAGGRVSTESLRLVEMGGEWFYLPRPRENPLPVAFRLVESGPRRLVFENREHDFPQRIGYELGEDGTLLAWIEGPADGEPRRVDFRYRRAPAD